MPASEAVVFDAFHAHQWRRLWDTLVRDTRAPGSAEYPSVGEVRNNPGAGWLRFLSVSTRFISFERPKVVAAVMHGQSFPFARWAASIRHRAAGTGSVMVYTYSIEVRPAWLQPLVAWAFERQTRRRFAALKAFLAKHADEVVAWQQRH